MKKTTILTIGIFLIFANQLFCQDSLSIIATELEEIIIKPKRKTKLTTFDLTQNKKLFKQGAKFPFPNHTSDNVGIYVPIKSTNELYISEVAFPIEYNQDTLLLRYALIVISENDKDSIIYIEPKNIHLESQKITLDIKELFIFNDSIKGFYFFIFHYNQNSENKITLQFSNKYKSALTFYLDPDNKIKINDLRPFINANADKIYRINFLNLKIMIKYLVK